MSNCFSGAGAATLGAIALGASAALWRSQQARSRTPGPSSSEPGSWGQAQGSRILAACRHTHVPPPWATACEVTQSARMMLVVRSMGVINGMLYRAVPPEQPEDPRDNSQGSTCGHQVIVQRSRPVDEMAVPSIPTVTFGSGKVMSPQ